MMVFTLLEFFTLRKLKSSYDRVEENSTIKESENEEEIDRKMREDALKGIMEAMDNNPTIYDINNAN